MPDCRPALALRLGSLQDGNTQTSASPLNALENLAMSPIRWGAIAIVVGLMSTAARGQGPSQPSASASIGAAENSIGRMPGAPAAGLELGADGSDGILLGHGGRKVPASIARPSAMATLQAPTVETVPTPRLPRPRRIETLAIPLEAEAEPVAQQGLTLDQAIDLLRRENLGLRAKALEIPQAQADILTAGLRANPFVYMDGQLLPYGQYSAANPGGPAQYDVNVTLPVDWNLKRRARQAVADRARTVVAAMYQNAVRIELGNLYNAYVDVLAGQETVRLASGALESIDRAVATAKSRKESSDLEIDQVELQRESAELNRLDAETALRTAKRRFAALLNLPASGSERLELAGTIHDRSPPPPPPEELLQLAMTSRPDLAAFRMGVTRAQADVLLARANRFSDVYVLYQPFTLQNNHPFNAQSSTSWTLGATVAVPLWDRNQGTIRRTQVNVQQTRLETDALERIIQTEVQDAYDEYVSTRRAVEEMKGRLLPTGRRLLDENLQLYRQGQAPLLSYLSAQHDYGELVRQYRDMLIRHRRSMLDLNTAIGQRILP